MNINTFAKRAVISSFTRCACVCVVAGAVGSPNTFGIAYCNSTVTRQCAAGVNANSIRQVCTFRCGSGLLPAFIYDNDLCQRFIEFFTPKHKCMHVVFVAAGKWPSLYRSTGRRLQKQHEKWRKKCQMVCYKKWQ